MEFASVPVLQPDAESSAVATLRNSDLLVDFYRGADRQLIQAICYARKRRIGSVEDVIPEGTPVEVWNTIYRRKSAFALCAVLRWWISAKWFAAACRWNLPVSGCGKTGITPTLARTASRRPETRLWSVHSENLLCCQGAFYPLLPLPILPPRNM